MDDDDRPPAADLRADEVLNASVTLRRIENDIETASAELTAVNAAEDSHNQVRFGCL